VFFETPRDAVKQPESTPFLTTDQKVGSSNLFGRTHCQRRQFRLRRRHAWNSPLSADTFTTRIFVERGAYIRAAGMPLQVVRFGGCQLRVGQLLLRQLGAERIPDNRGRCAAEAVRGDPSQMLGSAARSDRRMFASDIQPPSRFANTGPGPSDSAASARSASTPNRGRTTACGEHHPYARPAGATPPRRYGCGRSASRRSSPSADRPTSAAPAIHSAGHPSPRAGQGTRAADGRDADPDPGTSRLRWMAHFPLFRGFWRRRRKPMARMVDGSAR
jgi:hypothetical protein